MGAVEAYPAASARPGPGGTAHLSRPHVGGVLERPARLQRVSAPLLAVDDVPGGAQFTTELTFEREGGDKPVCVAESLARVYSGA